MPRWPTKTETEEQVVAQPQSLDIPTTGTLDDLVRVDQEIVIAQEGPAMSDYQKALAFMEEFVDVTVHESTDPNAEPIVDIYCQGIPQRFIRGQTQRVKRKYVEILANARQTSIKTKVHQDNDNVYNRIDKHTALRYPFSMNDSNPLGQAWLKGLLGRT